mgnify:FL=1
MATNTKNYNFKKPDESDFYDIQDQNGNWDIVDEKMEELSAPTFEDYSSTTSVPEASTAIEAIKSKKKIPEILANIKAAFKGVCLLGHIVNNCVTDNAKLPLSAAQGKALMDQITKLNSDVELWNGTLSSGQSLTVPGISKYRAIYATIQGYKRVMFLSDTQSGFCGASAQGAQLSMSRLDISGDTVTFSGMTINFNPDGSVSDTVIPECTRISGYLTKITI